jgi:hypothetical protein
MTVVGVAQEGFQNETRGDNPDLYFPISMREAISADWKGLEDRQNAWVTMFVRRKPGVSLADAENAINVPYRAQVEYAAARLKQPAPEMLKRFQARRIQLREGDYGRGGLREQASQSLWMMTGITAMVLLIACANVANLQLARATVRMREAAVRLAVGASRGQLIRAMLGESILLALAGAALGLLFSYTMIRGIVAALPGDEGFDAFFRPAPDARVLLVAMLLAAASGVAFGLFPALLATKTDLVTTLKDQAGQATGGVSSRFRKTLVTAQIALASMPLICGGLFAQPGQREPHRPGHARRPSPHLQRASQTEPLLERAQRATASPVDRADRGHPRCDAGELRVDARHRRRLQRHERERAGLYAHGHRRRGQRHQRRRRGLLPGHEHPADLRPRVHCRR